MPSVFERYALGRRPVPGRGRGRSSPPKKPGKKKPQPAWNGYLTDSARYKLPLKEQERRKNNYNFCGPVQPTLSRFFRCHVFLGDSVGRTGPQKS